MRHFLEFFRHQRRIKQRTQGRPGWNRLRSSRLNGRRGFSLVEIMVASLLFSVVMLVAWTGLMSALNMSQQAQAKTARKVELNMALDLLSNEVRQAQQINGTDIRVVSNTVSMEQVVVDSGINLADLGNYGDIALYMELPVDSRVNACDVDGVSIPAEKMDKVVYDVRESPVGWLPPYSVVRYGRIPDVDGFINPCSAPVANDIIADAIADDPDAPECGGVVTGSHGFHTCTENGNVELLFQSTIDDLNSVPISSAVTPRTVSALSSTGTQEPAPNSDLSMTVTGADGGNTALVSWVWESGLPADLTNYRLDIESPTIGSLSGLIAPTTNKPLFSHLLPRLLTTTTLTDSVRVDVTAITDPNEVIQFTLSAIGPDYEIPATASVVRGSLSPIFTIIDP